VNIIKFYSLIASRFSEIKLDFKNTLSLKIFASSSINLADSSIFDATTIPGGIIFEANGG